MAANSVWWVALMWISSKDATGSRLSRSLFPSPSLCQTHLWDYVSPAFLRAAISPWCNVIILLQLQACLCQRPRQVLFPCSHTTSFFWNEEERHNSKLTALPLKFQGLIGWEQVQNMFGVFLTCALVHTTEYISQLSRMFCSRLCKPPLEGQIFGKVSFYSKFTSFLKLKRTDFESKLFWQMLL